MIIHAAASSRTPHITVVIINLVFLTLIADPWCLVEAPHQISPMSRSSYVFRQGDLPKLELQIDRGSDFSAWQTQWELFMSLPGLGEETAVKQVQALTLCFSRETFTIVNNLGLTTEDRGNVTSIISAIKKYVAGHINESVERQNFRRRTQQPGESFDDFLVSLRELVKTCYFCNDACTQKSLRDQIIEGLLDGDTVEHLLQEKDLSLDKTVHMRQAQEAAKKQRAAIQKGPGNLHESVAALKTHPQKKTFIPQPLCPGCGAKPHPAGHTQCPVCVSCHNCKKLGHFSRVRRSKPIQPHPPWPYTSTLQSTQSNSSLSEQAGLSNIHHVTSTYPAPKLKIDITALNGTTTTDVLPDSGADISAAGTSILSQLNEHIDNLSPSWSRDASCWQAAGMFQGWQQGTP